MGFGLLKWYSYLTSFPLIGHWLFDRVFAYISPYSGSIPLQIMTISSGYCQTSMIQCRSILNPFHSIHAAALINQGEATTGLAVYAWVESQQQDYRAIVTRLECEYYKKVLYFEERPEDKSLQPVPLLQKLPF